MIFDFEHHYIPEKLARKKNLISDKVTFVESGASVALRCIPSFMT